MENSLKLAKSVWRHKWLWYVVAFVGSKILMFSVARFIPHREWEGPNPESVMQDEEFERARCLVGPVDDQVARRGRKAKKELKRIMVMSGAVSKNGTLCIPSNSAERKILVERLAKSWRKFEGSSDVLFSDFGPEAGSACSRLILFLENDSSAISPFSKEVQDFQDILK